MSRFGTRGAAEDLARALDGGATGGSPELALAQALRGTGTALRTSVGPRPEFRDALRLRLMAVATVQAAQVVTPAPARTRSTAVSWAPRFAGRGSAVAAGALASVVAVSGVAVAGSQSLPGDPFYGVKRTTEAFQLRTADGAVEKGTLHLDLAATRLREVRGLTLGRDAVDAGPQLGPAAMTGAFTLRSAEQPLAAGAALSAAVAERVRATLADMDEQTREGTELLTRAYRSSRTPTPLRALSRFTTRQSAGLEQLLPALPPATQQRARASLALLDGVSEQTDELLGIGTCGLGCDPSQAAPALPSAPGTSESPTSTGSCECATPAPQPQSSAAPPAPSPEPQQSPAESAEPTRSPAPAPASPAPSTSPSPSGGPLPLPPLPAPLPSALPIPIPTVTLAPPTVVEPVASALPRISSSSSKDSEPAPVPSPTPLPQLAPVAPRP